MPRQITTTVYQFSELSDAAKEKARDYFRNSDFDVFGWSDDWKASIDVFIDHFGASLKNWAIGPYSPVEYSVHFDNSNFRGMKLRYFDREHMPTGFCGDCDLWEKFYDEFKRTGDAKYAFDQAVYAGFIGWRNDWEAAYEDDSLDEFITDNEYEFTEDGERI